MKPIRLFYHTFILLVIFGWYESFMGLYGQVPLSTSERILRQNAAEQEARGEYSKAIEIYKKLLTSKPQDLSLYLAAKRCFLQNKDYQAWQNLIKELQKSFRDVQYEVDLAEIDYALGHKTEAIQRWKQIVRDNPTNERAYVLIGTVLTEHQLYEEAIDVFQSGRKSFKEPIKFCFELVKIYHAIAALEKLTEEYLNFLEKNPGQVNFVQGQLLNAAHSQEATEKITKVILERQKSKRISDIMSHQLLGALYTQQKDYKRGLRHYLALEEELKNTKRDEVGLFLFSFANAAMSDGATAEARRVFELLAATQTVNLMYRIKAEYNLAQLFEKEGNYLQAIKSYENFVETHKKIDDQIMALFRIGDIYFQKLFDISKAEVTYLKIVKMPVATQEDRLKARQRLSECAIARGDIIMARKYLDGIIKETSIESNYHRQAALKTCYLEMMNGQWRQSLERIEKIFAEGSATRPSSPVDIFENDLLDLYILLKDNEKDSVGVTLLGQMQWLQWRRSHGSVVDSIRKFLTNYPNSKLKYRLKLMEIESLRQLGRSSEAIANAKEMLVTATQDEKEKISKLIVDMYADDLHLWDVALKEGEAFLQLYPRSIYIDEIRQKVRSLEQKNRI